jgi:hypothetical protein
MVFIVPQLNLVNAPTHHLQPPAQQAATAQVAVNAYAANIQGAASTIINIKRNGVMEVGFEATADRSLSPAEHLQIPHSMSVANQWRSLWNISINNAFTFRTFDNPGRVYFHRGRFWVRYTVAAIDVAQNNILFAGLPARAASATVTARAAIPPALDVNNQPVVLPIGNDVTIMVPVEFVSIASYAHDHLEHFVTLNRTCLEQAGATHEQLILGLAGRYMAVAMGLGTPLDDDNTEWQWTANPVGPAAADVEGIINEMMTKDTLSKGLLLVCARAVSFMLTNHATGTSEGAGFMRKVMEQVDFVPRGANRQTRINATTVAHTAFHPIDVKTTLARLYPNDANLWGVFRPNAGVIETLTATASLRLRHTTPISIAGTALVTDAVAVLRVLAANSIHYALKHMAQMGALLTAYDNVQVRSMRCGIAAHWWVKNNTFGLIAEPIDQRSTDYYDLICELATAIINFSSTNSLRESPALIAAAAQADLQSTAALWKKIKLMLVSSTDSSIIKTIIRQRQVMVNAAQAVTRYVSPDVNQRALGATALNDLNRRINTSIRLGLIENMVALTDQELQEAEQNAADFIAAHP